jgi:hypothetical protein
MTTSSTATGPTGPADAVRSCAATGTATDEVEIVRRAERGEDELMLLVHVDRSWWVARRVAGVTRVCAYIGEDAAERDFELFLSSPSPRGQWAEVVVGEAAA